MPDISTALSYPDLKLLFQLKLSFLSNHEANAQQCHQTSHRNCDRKQTKPEPFITPRSFIHETINASQKKHKLLSFFSPKNCCQMQVGDATR
jgi:hypothetical protein